MSYTMVEAMYAADLNSVQHRLPLPLMISSVSAGFPSPAEGSIDKMLDLNELLVRRPIATFFVRVTGDSMRDAGILDGDLLVVEKGEKPRSSDIVLAVIEGEFTVKRWVCQGSTRILRAENSNYPDIDVTTGIAYEIWGVVRYAIHSCQQMVFSEIR